MGGKVEPDYPNNMLPGLWAMEEHAREALDRRRGSVKTSTVKTERSVYMPTQPRVVFSAQATAGA